MFLIKSKYKSLPGLRVAPNGSKTPVLIFMSFATALIMEPISTLTGAASILTLSRALRSKPIMKYLTNPRLRAYEAERAMKIGADIDPFLRRNLAREKARESAKVRKDKPVADERIYYNMPKKKTTAAKKTTKKATTKKTSK